MKFRYILYSTTILCLWMSCKTTPKVTEADYQRAESFTPDSIRKKIFRLAVHPEWFEDSSGFVYRAYTRDGEKYYRVSYDRMTREAAFNEARLADSLSRISGTPVPPKNLMLGNMDWPDQNRVIFTFHGKRYEADLKHDHLTLSPDSFHRRTENESYSPDGKEKCFMKDDNLFVQSIGSPSPVRLSATGSKFHIFGSYYGWGDVMEGEDAAPKPHLMAVWSPDSRKIYTQIMDATHGEKMYLLNWSVDSMYRPVLLSYYRASPGDTDDVKYTQVIFDVRSRKMIRIDLPPMPHFLAPYLQWTPDGKHLFGLCYHRGYKRLDLIEVSPETGKVRVILTDSSRTYVEGTTQLQLIQRDGIAFMTSERSGWNQLYRVDWSTGVIHAVTDGAFVVKDLLAVDTAHKVLYFTAAGMKKDVNPYYNSLYRIGFDGSGLKSLTPESVNHEVVLSPDKRYFLDNASSPTQPTVSLLRSTADGKILLKVDSADISDLLQTGWHYPEIFTVTARDGHTRLYGALWKPTNFNPHHRYPLIDASYTGPQMHVFPESFSKAVFTSAQSQAELGFVVMAVDGLGTAGRSKAFHNWSYKHMGNNLADHVLAIRELGNRYRWIDTSRVGIYGHSAGGYDAAHALMAFNSCYKVAVSESGDHDWRMEKAWWPEMYVGWPVDSNYQLQSNITMAPRLKGKLLLIHGGIDENVNPSATFKLSEALIKASIPFDMLIIPSAHHGYPSAYRPYLDRRRWSYFVEHLILHPPGVD